MIDKPIDNRFPLVSLILPFMIWIINLLDMEPDRSPRRNAFFIPHYLLIKSTMRALYIVVNELHDYILMLHEIPKKKKRCHDYFDNKLHRNFVTFVTSATGWAAGLATSYIQGGIFEI
jgi:hypothetical protein